MALKNYANRLFIFAFIVGIFVFGGLVQSVRADTFIVDVTGDTGDANPGDGFCADVSGDCTLRAAVEEANALAGDDTITFSVPDNSTISPTPAINITSNIVIDASDVEGLTLDGGWDGNVGTVGTRIFFIDTHGSVGVPPPGLAVSFIHFTMAEGNAGIETSGGDENNARSNGGCVYIDDPNGTFTFEQMTIDHCRANDGGGLNIVRGNLTVSNSTFSNNRAFDDGGSIDLESGAVGTFVNVTFANNESNYTTESSSPGTGGAARVDGTATLIYVTAFNNTGQETGGFDVNGPGVLITRNSIIMGNISTNTVNENCDAFGSTLTNNGFSWTEAGTGCTGLTTATVVAVALNALADNGGPTETVSLGDGILEGTSSVGGAIPTTEADCPTVPAPVSANIDQRGAERAGGGINDGGTGCEPGAYELSAESPTAVTLHSIGVTGSGSGSLLFVILLLGVLLTGTFVLKFSGRTRSK